jgi:hypothetical protein
VSGRAESGATARIGKENIFILFYEEQQHFHIFEQQKSSFTSWSQNKSCLEFNSLQLCFRAKFEIPNKF